jgi:P4 family phage/plasmid primase-like protien
MPQKKEKIPSTVRNTVWNKYIGKNNEKGLCFCCNTEDISSANFHCGHVVSEKNGGKVTIDNMRPLCSQCNTSMGSSNMEEFMKKYGFEKSLSWNGNINKEEAITIKEEQDKKTSKQAKKSVKKIVNDKPNEEGNNDKRLEIYLECLNTKRFEDYDDWIKVGFIIYNEKGTCELYDRYSKKAKNYDNKCFEKWSTFKDGNNKASIKTLIDMAKEDNSEKYIAALLKDKYGIIDDIFQNGITDVTCSYMFYCLCSNEYIYDTDNSEWYKINKYGIYERDNKSVLLKDHINKVLFRTIEREFIDRSGNIEDEEIKTTFTKRYVSIRRYLLHTKNKDNVITELSLLYKRSKIYEKFDNVNNYALAFKNGVYDLKTNEFRDAKPEELITCTTGYDYSEPKSENIKFLEKVLLSIMPDKEEREYLLKTISLGLRGDNLLEEFYIYIGVGQNGKGLLRDLIKNTLGEYFDNIEIEYFAKTKMGIHANSADSVMARKKNSRMVITTEPEGDVNLRCAKLKQISGRDPVQVRDLYKSPFNFVPKFKLIIQTNKEVSVDGSDPGVIRRLRFIKFPNTFVDNPKQPNEREIDRTLKEKINDDEYKLAFFHILLYYYNDFIKNNNNKLDMPSRIKNDTKEYLNNNDPVQQFVDERIDRTKSEKDFISSSELYEGFKGFHGGDNKNISVINFKSILTSKGFNFKRTKKGISCSYIKWKPQEVNLLNQNAI